MNRFKYSILLMLVLIGAQANAMYRDVEADRAALKEAVLASDINAVRSLLDAGVDVDMVIVEGRGRTPLMKAARRGDASMVNLLLDYGADVNLTDSFGDTADDKAEFKGYHNVASAIRARRG